MKNLNEIQKDRLNKSIKYWFILYFKELVSLEELIESLEEWEESLKGTQARKKVNLRFKNMNFGPELEETENERKNLWFRFYNGDTLATTIKDIERDLNPTKGTRGNREHLREKINISLQENSLEINFS